MLLRFLPVLLLTGSGALAQSACPDPALRVLRDNQPVPSAGAPLAPQVTLQLTANGQCAASTRYQFTEAELTLVRNRRPLLPQLHTSQPAVDLSTWISQAQPGDRVYVFVPYKNLRIVGADGQARPYPLPTDGGNKVGVGFNWVLTQN